MQYDLISWENKFTDYLRTNHQTDDAAHDLHHFKRVWRTAQRIMQAEQALQPDPLIILTAAYFHDFISLPKNHPDAAQSSRLCADTVSTLLKENFPDFPEEKIPGVRHAIHAHSFSAKVTPETPEAMILQDADRMEAIGAIGIARVFYTAGLLHKDLFEPDDPLATNRPLDDKQYALDHFRQKLLKLPALMNTATGRAMADDHAAYLKDFMDRMYVEVTVNTIPLIFIP